MSSTSAKVKSETDLKPYWVGSYAEIEWNGQIVSNPVHCPTLGGMDFPITAVDRPWVSGLETGQDRVHDGEIRMLDEARVKQIKKAAKSKVARTQGNRTIVLSTKSARYVARSTDVPLGAFCYIMELEDRTGYPETRFAKPETLVKA
jgi:hypothetical protein